MEDDQRTTRATAPGWYDDPHGRFDYRYHNGQRWTPDVSSGGARFIDPLGVAPTPPGTVPQKALPPHVAAVVPPGWAGPPVTTRHPARTMSVLSLVFGLVAVALALVPFLFVIGALAAVAALVLGIAALRRYRALGPTASGGRGRAVAGIVLAPVALALCGVGFVFTRVTLREIDEYTKPGPYRLEVSECSIANGFARASGTITNHDDRERGYIIVIEYRERGRVEAKEHVEVERVAASQTASWSDDRFLGDVQGTDLTCTTRQVTGPYPFGLSPNG